jgi:hypothetical protein
MFSGLFIAFMVLVYIMRQVLSSSEEWPPTGGCESGWQVK